MPSSSKGTGTEFGGVTSNIEDVQGFFSELGRDIYEQAERAARNRIAAQARTQVRREVSAETGVPIKALRNRFRLHSANRGRPIARLWIGTVPVDAYRDLGAKELSRGGVSYRGPGGRARNPSGFIATMPSGKTRAFARRGKARLPIDAITVPIHGPARRIARRVSSTLMRTKFVKEFHGQLKFRVDRARQRHRLRGR